FEKIKNIKVLDPAVGSGHFLASFVSFNIRLHEFLWNEAKKHDLKNILIIQISDTREDLVSFKDFKEITAILKNYIFTNVVYGIDINHDAVIITKIWLLLNYIKSWNSSYMDLLHPRHLNFNLFTGNSLIGFGNWDEIAEVVNVKSLNIILLKNKILKMFKSLQKIVNKERLDISIAKIESDQFDTIKFLKNTQFLLQNLGKYITNHPEESRKNGIYQIQKSITIKIRNFYDDLFLGFSRITGQKIEKFGEITPFHWVFEFPEIFPMNINDFGFDIILGNPPYGNLISTTEKKVIKPFYSFLNEISAVFIERAMNLNKIGGMITFLTSYAICFSKDFSNIRKKIAKTYKINKFATFDRDKCRFFTNMTQSVSIIQCINKFSKPLAKNQFSDILTTNMYRKMPDLRDLKYFPVKKFLLGKQIGVTFDQKHRLPKIGYKWLVELLTFISTLYHLNPNKKMLILGDILNSFLIIRNSDAYRKKLIQFEKEGKRKKNLLSIRISGNYWYNAWNEPPYFGSQIALIEITKPYNGLKDFLLILINSSFYYVWFRIYSDGRHMNSDIMKALPLPKDLQKKLRKFCEILKVFSSFLMKKLNYFYDKEYRRFSTSKMKHIIDICDLFLGEMYDIPDEMVEHIQNFEPSIRGGKKISNEISLRIRNLLKDNRDNKNIEGLIVEFKDILELIENNENLAENK
ncbi:MAG: Eco57I restriction-modification methylase domain-containing protein, partial [Promethearchaeota archaeon]